MRVRNGIGLGAIAVVVFVGGMLARSMFAPEHEAALPATLPQNAAPHAEAEDAAVPVAPARVEHAVFSLVDNRHAAHRFVGGAPVLDGGDIGFARYTRFGLPRWRLGHVRDGERAAIAERDARLEIPLSAEHAARAAELVVRVHAAAGQQLALEVNGRSARDGKAARIALVAGWQTIAVSIAAGRLREGENQLVLETRGARGQIGVGWLRLGPAGLPVADPRPAARFDAAAEALALARDASLVWYLTVPDGAHLVAAVAGACTIEVRARASDGRVAGGLLAADQPRVDLTAMAGRVVALALTARGCPAATLARPRITVHGPRPERRPASAAPRYIVLWVMDALRADKVPAFTPGARAQTPSLDELAKTSAVFRQYYVQGNESQTSHASVWTGLYPAVHGVRLAGVGGTYRLDPTFELIATRLAAAGFATTAVTGNGFVIADSGYARGFGAFRNMMRERGVINGILYGATIVDAALRQLDAVRAGPAYLFLGTIDTHGPWIARKPWIDRYSPGRYDGPFQRFGTAKELGIRRGKMGCSIVPPPRDIERLRAIYDSAISYQDQQLGRFIAQLQQWGIWDQTMLIITADHGEELFEAGRCGHGGSLRDSLVRVPLLIHDPARFPGGTIVDEGAEGVDVLPTILDALGVAPAEAAQGRSLIPLAQGLGRGWPQPSYASQYEYAHAMRIGRWKIRVGKRGVPIVADLVADPDEQVDRAATAPVERRMLTDNLGLFLALRAQWQKRAWGVPTNVSAAGARALDEARTP